MTREDAKIILYVYRAVNLVDASHKDAFDMAIKALEQEPCEDAISRSDAIRVASGYCHWSNIPAELAKLPSVSTGNPNNCDLISREWLKTAIHNFYHGLKHTPTEEDIQAYIGAAPSVSTEKTGHWEWVQYDSNPNMGDWHCSECNRIVSGAIKAANPVYSYKYCPNCGAKMGVEE